MKNISKHILFFCLFISYQINAQKHSVDAIDSLVVLNSIEFDTAFALTGLTFPVILNTDTTINDTWIIEGDVVDFINGLGCGCVLCTAGISKVLLTNKTKFYKNEFAYIIFFQESNSLNIYDANVKIEVKYANKKDIAFFSIILNKFNIKTSFLIEANK